MHRIALVILSLTVSSQLAFATPRTHRRAVHHEPQLTNEIRTAFETALQGHEDTGFTFTPVYNPDGTIRFTARIHVDPVTPSVTPTPTPVTLSVTPPATLSAQSSTVIVHSDACSGNHRDYLPFAGSYFRTLLLQEGFEALSCQNDAHPEVGSVWNLQENFKWAAANATPQVPQLTNEIRTAFVAVMQEGEVPATADAVTPPGDRTVTTDPTPAAPVTASLSSQGTMVIVHWDGCTGTHQDLTQFEASRFLTLVQGAGFTTLRCHSTDEPNNSSMWRLVADTRSP